MTSKSRVSNSNNNEQTVWALGMGDTIAMAMEEPILEPEACYVRAMDDKKELPFLVVLQLAFQSLGVVYGDLSTSPLYVFSSVFPTTEPDREKVLGALSLIIYSLILIPFLKYVLIVMRANDDGEGGTFAIYSLICRHANLNAIPSQHRAEESQTYSRNNSIDNSISAKVTNWLEAKFYMRNTLLIIVLLGTCMIIGDGIFTPAISVMSSVSGIREGFPKLKNEIVVIMALVILLLLFSVQHYGTNKVGWFFAPAAFLWLISIGVLGAYNVFKHDIGVLKALSPLYIVKYFQREGKQGWLSLGGIIICITGSEAIFADLGHFSSLSVQIAFTGVVLPCLLLQYMGQAAYLIHNPSDANDSFYSSVPDAVRWPILFIATIATVIASQASISATFSIIKQSLSLGCFPRVKVLHTSSDISGQIYIPEVNWILMVLCLAVTAGFPDIQHLANAYGFAVIVVMIVTTALMALLMLIVWQTHWFLITLFTCFFLSVELVYFSAMLFKIGQGGWAPLVIATTLLAVMYCWHYGQVKRYQFEIESKIPVSYIVGLGPGLGLVRVPGVGLLYTELVHGVPHIFSHLITHIPAVHSIVVFVCIKYLPVNTVPQEERFLVKRIGPRELSMFRCVARYGYKDLHKKDDNFERRLFEALCAFVRLESLMESCSDSEYSDYEEPVSQSTSAAIEMNRITDTTLPEIASARLSQPSNPSERIYQTQRHFGYIVPLHGTLEDQLRYLQNCWDAGVVHILGSTVITARKGSNFVQIFAIDYMYAFLRKICRDNNVIFNVPQESLLNVGQICHV